MEFVLMKLEFFDSPSGNFSYRPPQFSHISGFRTSGVVMNVFLLDPTKRLLSAFVWLSTFNTIGLYVLLDWEKEEYVFIDTAIEGVRVFSPALAGCSNMFADRFPPTGHVIQLVLHSL